MCGSPRKCCASLEKGDTSVGWRDCSGCQASESFGRKGITIGKGESHREEKGLRFLPVRCPGGCLWKGRKVLLAPPCVGVGFGHGRPREDSSGPQAGMQITQAELGIQSWDLFCLFTSFCHNQRSHIGSLTSAGCTGETGYANLLGPSWGGSYKKRKSDPCITFLLQILQQRLGAAPGWTPKPDGLGLNPGSTTH